MSECRRILERLAPWADESLSPAEHAEVDRHLAACAPCRTAAGSERAGRQILRTCATRLSGEPLPLGFRTRCEALAREHAPRQRAGWTLGKGWLRTLAPVTIVAILLVFTAST